MSEEIKACPCGSELSFKECCSLYIEKGEQAPDPEALMRSRYTAFVLANMDYVKSTWHPDTLPELDDSEPSNWVDLEVIDCLEDEEGTEGEVEYKARLVIKDKLETIHEVSDFVKVNGRWLYHSGEFKEDGCTSQKISMKSDCPCGSGERFKHCHFSKK